MLKIKHLKHQQIIVCPVTCNVLQLWMVCAYKNPLMRARTHKHAPPSIHTQSRTHQVVQTTLAMANAGVCVLCHWYLQIENINSICPCQVTYLPHCLSCPTSCAHMSSARRFGNLYPIDYIRWSTQERSVTRRTWNQLSQRASLEYCVYSDWLKRPVLSHTSYVSAGDNYSKQRLLLESEHLLFSTGLPMIQKPGLDS